MPSSYRIVIDRVEPTNSDVEPFWLAKWKVTTGVGSNPLEALVSVLDSDDSLKVASGVPEGQVSLNIQHVEK